MTKRRYPKGVYYETIPLYELGLYIVFDADAAATRFDEDFVEVAFPEGVAGQVLTASEDGVTFVVMYLPETDANTIAHEAVHAAWRALSVVGVYVEEDNQEPLAYLVGYIVERIYARLGEFSGNS